MKTKDFIEIEECLLSTLAGYAIHKSLMFIAPLGHFLRGFSFEGSSFDRTSFYVNAFVMPLYVPSEYITLTFGNRLREQGGDRWSSTMPGLIPKLISAIEKDGLPLISKADSPHGFITMLKSFSSINPHVSKAIGYSYARMGDVSRAIDTFDLLLPQLDMQVAWQVQIAEQITALKTELQGDPAAVQRTLDTHEIETTRSIGLEQFRQS